MPSPITFNIHICSSQQKDGIGGSYRLASLDRLANRQRILEQNGGLGNVNLDRNGKNHEHSNGHAAAAVSSTNGSSSSSSSTTTPTATTTSSAAAAALAVTVRKFCNYDIAYTIVTKL